MLVVASFAPLLVHQTVFTTACWVLHSVCTVCVMVVCVVCLTSADIMAGDDHYLHTTNQVNSPVEDFISYHHCLQCLSDYVTSTSVSVSLHVWCLLSDFWQHHDGISVGVPELHCDDSDIDHADRWASHLDLCLIWLYMVTLIDFSCSAETESRHVCSLCFFKSVVIRYHLYLKCQTRVVVTDRFSRLKSAQSVCVFFKPVVKLGFVWSSLLRCESLIPVRKRACGWSSVFVCVSFCRVSSALRALCDVLIYRKCETARCLLQPL